MTTPLRVSIVAAIASFGLLLVIFELMRSRRLQERYALLWLLTGIVMLVLALWRDALGRIADLVGIAYPPSALFVLGAFFILRRASSLLDGDLEAFGAEHQVGPENRIARGKAGGEAPRDRARGLGEA